MRASRGKKFIQIRNLNWIDEFSSGNAILISTSHSFIPFRRHSNAFSLSPFYSAHTTSVEWKHITILEHRCGEWQTDILCESTYLSIYILYGISYTFPRGINKICKFWGPCLWVNFNTGTFTQGSVVRTLLLTFDDDDTDIVHRAQAWYQRPARTLGRTATATAMTTMATQTMMKIALMLHS